MRLQVGVIRGDPFAGAHVVGNRGDTGRTGRIEVQVRGLFVAAVSGGSVERAVQGLPLVARRPPDRYGAGRAMVRSLSELEVAFRAHEVFQHVRGRPPAAALCFPPVEVIQRRPHIEKCVYRGAAAQALSDEVLLGLFCLGQAALEVLPEELGPLECMEEVEAADLLRRLRAPPVLSRFQQQDG